VLGDVRTAATDLFLGTGSTEDVFKVSRVAKIVRWNDMTVQRLERRTSHSAHAHTAYPAWELALRIHSRPRKNQCDNRAYRAGIYGKGCSNGALGEMKLGGVTRPIVARYKWPPRNNLTLEQSYVQ
jgi:hypothetical protein